MENNLEQLTEEMTDAVKHALDVSLWKKNRKASPLLNVVLRLNNIPKITPPLPHFERVRNQILDRIALPKVETQSSWFTAFWPSVLRYGVMGLGTLLIVISLTMGTAVAALESFPGQAIYPLKKVVESIELKLASADEKTSLQLQFANNRLEELQQLLDQNQQGKISDAETKDIISQTVKDLQIHTSAAVRAAANEPQVLNKLAAISSKLKSVSTQSEGDVKIELEKALEASQLSQEQAIENIENAGLKIENQPILIPDSVNASGTLRLVRTGYVVVGDVKFRLTDDTVYVNFTVDDLKPGLTVDIQGEIKNNETFATKITLITEPEISVPVTSPDTNEPDIIVIPDDTDTNQTPATP